MTEAQPARTSNVLRDILESTRARVTALRAHQGALERAAADAAPIPAWLSAFGSEEVAVIAEIKRRSPSAGMIAPDLDPASHARAYVVGGAGALSVLTEPDHFGGSLEDLGLVHAAVNRPILRKDFLLDPLQVLEARVAGASAVLLIARVLSDAELKALYNLARALDLGVLIEIHQRNDLARALAVEPTTIGVNARDLATLRVDPEGVLPLLRAVPDGIVRVAESALTTRADVERVARAGADAILVGTALAGAPDPAAAVRALVGVRRQGPSSEGASPS